MMPENKKSKHRKNKKGSMFAVKTVSIIFVVLLLLFMTSEILNVATVSQISDSVRNFFATLTPGDGFPHKVNSSSVKDMTVLNGNFFILTDEKTVSLDTTAKQVKATQHTYSNPNIDTCGGKVIVYNRNDNRYRIENRTETLYEGKTPPDEKIITASIGKKGNVALATFAKSSTSKLTVLDSHYKKKLFVWNCAHDSIIAVDLSPNGKCAAVAVIGSRDGEIYSKVYVFDFRYKEPIGEFEYPGTAMIDLNFVTNDNIIVVGDNKTSFIKGIKKETSLDYGTSTLSAYAFSNDGLSTLVLSEYGSTNSEILTCYNSSFVKVFDEKYSSNVKSLYAEDSKITVLLDDSVLVYRGDGEQYEKFDADSTAISAFTIGRHTYLYSIGKIEKCVKK